MGVKKMDGQREIILTKQVAKHGTQSIIILPKFLESEIQPKDIVELRIKVVRRA
jgi:hypothetical protein